MWSQACSDTDNLPGDVSVRLCRGWVREHAMIGQSMGRLGMRAFPKLYLVAL